MFERAVLILLPIFVIIGAGYVSGRLCVLGDDSAKILNRFVTHISLPVLLFGALAKESLDRIFDLPFIASLGVASLICFLLPWALMPGGKIGLGQRAMRGMGASFAAVSFTGIPVLTPLIGTLALPAVGVANIILLVVMVITIVCVELERSGGGGLLPALRTALMHSFKNPIVVGSVAGLAYSMSGLGLPGWISRTTDILGAATPPVALFALGEALVRTRFGRLGEIGLLTAIKLVAMPLITLGVLMLFPEVEPQWAVAAVALAALATAVLEYMLAADYHEYVEQASGLVLLSTVLSAVTLPVFIVWSLHLWPIG